jgi:DNA repair protein RadC
MGALKIHELPEQERPREKLAAHGAGALSDSELIAILLRTGIPGANAVDIGRQLILQFGSLAALSRASLAELAKIKGVGRTKAVQLAAAFGLASRLARESLSDIPLDTPVKIYELLGAEMRQLGKESLRVVLLDSKLRLLRIEQVSLGSLNECLAHPREILRPAVLHNAFAFVLVHNHPSGDPAPSDADRRVTMRMAEAAKMLQVNFFDHMILGSPSTEHAPYFSFREAGVI